jgi:hypothetical protein
MGGLRFWCWRDCSHFSQQAPMPSPGSDRPPRCGPRLMPICGSLRQAPMFMPAKRSAPEPLVWRTFDLLTTPISVWDPRRPSGLTSSFTIPTEAQVASPFGPRAEHFGSLRARKAEATTRSGHRTALLACAVEARCRPMVFEPSACLGDATATPKSSRRRKLTRVVLNEGCTPRRDICSASSRALLSHRSVTLSSTFEISPRYRLNAVIPQCEIASVNCRGFSNA